MTVGTANLQCDYSFENLRVKFSKKFNYMILAFQFGKFKLEVGFFLSV